MKALAGNTPTFKYLEDLVPTGTYAEWKVCSASAKMLVSWARLAGLQEIEPAELLHTTIMYSPEGAIPPERHVHRPLDCPHTISEYVPRCIELFGPNKDIVVLAFQDSCMQAEFNRFVASGCLPSYPEYKPHITLATGPQADSVLRYIRANPPRFPITFDTERVSWCNSES